MKFLMIYCVYNPDDYLGHYNKEFDAENIEDAEKQGKAFLAPKLALITSPIEYRLFEFTNSTGHKVLEK